MKLFKAAKNNLDEMQEQKLLKLESRGFWLLWWALVVSMAVQMLVYGFEGRELMLGEWVVFMVSCVYMVIGCIRLGIWDRKLKASFKNNLIYSIIAGLATCLLIGLSNYRSFGMPVNALLSGALAGCCTFVLCLLALSLCSAAYKKRRAKLDEENEE